ncbi:MAG: hypothetical protein IT334_04220 [Thermomicrobiales bacterium]|nr:hypothetical protein [Thermomicrobiales bacterium]
MAPGTIEANATTPVSELLTVLKHDGDRIRVTINGQPIVLEVQRVRETAHLTPEEKMRLIQDAFSDTPSEIATFDSELERFKSPLDFE